MPVSPAKPEVIPPPTTEPVFNSFRRKPQRLFYFLIEFQLGLVILLVLVVILAWVLWRGAHPQDPLLFEVPEHLLTDKGGKIPVYERPVEPWIEPGTVPAVAGGVASGTNPFAPFPADVVGVGWKAVGQVEMFDESNLYSKINGRETFYKALGFQKLHYLSLVSAADPDLTIDIELFDQGTVTDAVGALSGEISRPDQPVTMQDQSIWYATRNGGFLARGRYYARLIGADDHPAIRTEVTRLQQTLQETLPGESLPWVYRLFVGGIQVSPGAIVFEKENAFAFAFANEFYRVKVSADGAELFVSRRADASEARALAAKLADGFGAYAERVPTPEIAGADAVFMKHTYLKTFEGVRPVGVYVTGVRGAGTAAEAASWMQRLSGKLEEVTTE